MYFLRKKHLCPVARNSYVEYALGVGAWSPLTMPWLLSPDKYEEAMLHPANVPSRRDLFLNELERKHSGEQTLQRIRPWESNFDPTHHRRSKRGPGAVCALRLDFEGARTRFRQKSSVGSQRFLARGFPWHAISDEVTMREASQVQT